MSHEALHLLPHIFYRRLLVKDPAPGGIATRLGLLALRFLCSLQPALFRRQSDEERAGFRMFSHEIDADDFDVG